MYTVVDIAIKSCQVNAPQTNKQAKINSTKRGYYNQAYIRYVCSHNLISRPYPCYCDEDCHLYGDCCRDLTGLASTTYQKDFTNLSPDSFSCNHLHPQTAGLKPRVRTCMVHTSILSKMTGNIIKLLLHGLCYQSIFDIYIYIYIYSKTGSYRLTTRRDGAHKKFILKSLFILKSKFVSYVPNHTICSNWVML